MRPKPRFFTGAGARAIDARTPKDRDRVADFLRVVAIALVVLGHWLVAVVLVRDGQVVADRLLDLEPRSQWLTWIFQVMPLFFVIGGFVNARSWKDALKRGDGWASWVQTRSRRLLAPLLPLVVFWVLLVAVLVLARWPGELVQTASQTAFAPLWFLATYLLVIALVPFTWALHRAWGAWALVAFALAAAVVDALARLGVPFVAYANLWFVWAGIHQCGYFWPHARWMNRATVGLGFLVLGIGALVVLVMVVDYPVSMVTVGGETPNNAGPPTFALFALLVAQVGVILAVRRRLASWLNRPRVWALVATVGSLSLTFFLWHVTALILAAALIHATGLWEPARIDAVWWMTRPLWVLACGTILAILVGGVRRFESVDDRAPSARPWRTGLGLAAVLVAVAWINRRGYEPDVPYLSGIAVALTLAGLWAIGAVPPWRLRSKRVYLPS